MIVNNRQNEARISLNKKFYDAEAIANSLNDFKKVCRGRIISKKSRIDIILQPYNKMLMDRIGYEFCNYVLGLMKNKFMV